MKKNAIKRIIKTILFAIIPFMLLLAVPILSLINYNKGNNFLSSGLNDLINFKEPGLDNNDKPYWDSLSNIAENNLLYYKNKIISAISERSSEIDQEKNKELFIKKFSFLPNEVKNKNKNNLIDGIYLGYQVFGNAAPVFSQMGETERFLISNFSALEKAGYRIFINNNSPEFLTVLNMEENKNYNYEGLNYNQIDNIQNSDSIFYKLNKTYNVNESSFEKSVQIKLIAVLTDNLAQKTITPPLFFSCSSSLKLFDNRNRNLLKRQKVLNCIDPLYDSESRKMINIKFAKSSSLDFLEWNLFLWMKFDYSVNEIYIKLYAASMLLSLYATAGEVYMNYIDPNSWQYRIKNQPLSGLNDIFQAGISTKDKSNWDLIDPRILIGSRDADQLYYAYKFNSFYDRFLVKKTFSFGEVDIYITLDQNMPIAKDEKTLKELIKIDSEKIVNNKMINVDKNDSLPYSKWYEFDEEIEEFTGKVWNKVSQIQERMLG